MGPHGTVSPENAPPKIFTTRMKKRTLTTVTTATKELEWNPPVRRNTIPLWQDYQLTLQHMQ
eukprot:6893084-Karenia_brevis.AAC.1